MRSEQAHMRVVRPASKGAYASDAIGKAMRSKYAYAQVVRPAYEDAYSSEALGLLLEQPEVGEGL
jgi:hypothetical protein